MNVDFLGEVIGKVTFINSKLLVVLLKLGDTPDTTLCSNKLTYNYTVWENHHTLIARD